MNSIFDRIKRLRRISFFLFFVPTIALILSLLLHNIVVSYNFLPKKILNSELPVSIKCTE